MKGSAASVARPLLPADLTVAKDPALAGDTEWRGLDIEGDFSGQRASRLEATGCRLVNSRLTGTQLPGARLVDVTFRNCELSGAIFTEASLWRARFESCRMRGASFAEAVLRDVSFADCRLDEGDFRMCSGQRAGFEGCSLAGADFYAARVDDAHFFNCELVGTEFSKATLEGGRLHGSKLEDLRGASYLRGVTISSAQLVPLAMQLLSAMGVSIDDEQAPDDG